MSEENLESPRETRVSRAFIIVLSIISIIGFLSIILQSIFNLDLSEYVEIFWLLILGIGFVIESDPKYLIKNIRSNLKERSFSGITTFIIGFLAIISAVFSVPGIEIEAPIFLATKGIVSIIAIIFIIIQTWIIK